MTRSWALILLFNVLLQVGCPLVCFAQKEDNSGLDGIISSLSDASGEQKSLLSSFGLNAEAEGGGGGLLSDITPAKIMAWVIFNSIGFVAFVYGKKQKVFGVLIIGILLMTYNMFVTNTAWLYTVGVGLCVALYFFRE